MVAGDKDLAEWVGRTERVVDDMAVWPAKAVAAMLDDAAAAPGPGGALPPLWQWFYFLATVPASGLAVDGHPERGGFMPPVDLPRRMFAGARMQFHQPLELGQPAVRDGVIRDVVAKRGSSGALVFVTVGYEFRQNGVLCIEEEQDIVYREPGQPVPAPEPVAAGPVDEGTWYRDVVPDPRVLFRFSALTFNAHRIHYDRPYAREEEGYPGLIVHGPLTAVMLAQLVAANSNRRIETFSFRGRSPLFDLAPFRLLGLPDGDRVRLEVRGPDGRVTQSADAGLGPA